MLLSNALSGLNPQNFSLKNVFLKKPALKNFLIFWQKIPSKFQQRKLSYILLEKALLIFWEIYSESWHIQNLRHNSKHDQNIDDGTYCKNSYVAHISASTLKIFPQNKFLTYLKKKNLFLKNFLHFLKRKLVLHFWKWSSAFFFNPSSKNNKNSLRENFLYLGNENPE